MGLSPPASSRNFGLCWNLGPREVLAQHRTLTETELVHRYGASLGSFWAALAQFGDGDGCSGDSRDDESESNEIGYESGVGSDGGEVDAMNVDTADAGEGEKRAYSSGSEAANAASNSRPRPKRTRTQPHRPEFVDSQTVQAQSSSPSKPSGQGSSQNSSTAYVADVHTSAAMPELATIQIAASFLRHVTQNCPP
ncbi:uncharacterized protein B0H64DRAFT_247738 [Chaetomium fimeti]|uniref:Uncharacterized protein n=1 Tax=Chaetomium fimeti TaxID=1854472 RepID=A0AAE0H7S6_9PEZI|nr:hypothetical protein B0H64DRAFT_247738 [Chaetomium fimeti]